MWNSIFKKVKCGLNLIRFDLRSKVAVSRHEMM